MSQTSLGLRAPSVFSLLREPEAVINFVASFAKTYAKRPISDVHLDLTGILDQDLGAHALLDKLVDEIEAACRLHGARMGWKGNFPKDASQARFIRAMGIVRQLGLQNWYLSPLEASRVTTFERRCRHYIRAIRPELKDDKSKAVEKFADHVNRCLRKEDKVLTPTARHLLCSYIGEVIDNAENHVGLVDWSIQGYLDMGTAEPYCEIVVFNFGKSIAQTLQELPGNSYTSQQIAGYLAAHQTKNWFSPSWRVEDLMTLVALQGGVSSKNTSIDGTRGNGTADLIEFFQRMHDERIQATGKEVRMCIISGDTRILFDGTYRMAANEQGTRLLAFNRTNDLHLPPDSKYVMPLNNAHLPGTMIAIQFPIALPSLTATGEMK